jgi:hypothetical protein
MDPFDPNSLIGRRCVVSVVSHSPRVQIVNEAGDVLREEPEQWSVEDLVVLPPDWECITGETVGE